MAAREANRTRGASEVLARFSSRPELFEVLCFYCGQLRNIPQITGVIQHLLEAGSPLLARRCLLNVTETPATDVIQAVVEALFGPIPSPGEHTAELESLASLVLCPTNN